MYIEPQTAGPTKPCSTCKIVKKLEDFHKSPATTDKRNRICKTCCQKRYQANRVEILRKSKERYPQKKDKITAYNRERTSKLIAAIQKLKSSHGCFNCNEREGQKLHFHHLNPSTKVDNISRLVKGCKIQTLIPEIKKCVICCSNCHNDIHHNNLKVGPEHLCTTQVEDYLTEAGFKI